MNKNIKLSTYWLILMTLLITGCATNFPHQIEKQENSLTLILDSLQISLEIIDESIIHVKKQKNGEITSGIPDYISILEPRGIPWSISEKNEKLIISTGALNVLVNADGCIEYQTKDSRKLVTENEESTFISQGNGNKISVSQTFTAENEGIYGLGQFQSGIMNWKSVPVRLSQTNLEIAIPFIVSTKDYGIYWHNYSETEFNPPEHELIFTNTIDEEMNVRETTFIPELSGNYNFLFESNQVNEVINNTKIYVVIDGDSIISYTTFWEPVCFSGSKYLEKGKAYKVTTQNTNSQEPGRLFYNEPDHNKTVFSSTAGESIDYYFIHSRDPKAVISEYQRLTGKAPLFPKSAYGFWQCRKI